LQQALDRFQTEHPNITVEVTPMRADVARSLAERVRIAQADVFLAQQDTQLVAGEGPLVLNLDELAGSWEGLDDSFPGLVDIFRYQGSLYAVPAALDLPLMYYNRALFDAQGIPYPRSDWTWQDFLATAQQMTTIAGEGDQQTGQWGFVSHPTTSSDLFFIIWQRGGRLLDDSTDPPGLIFDDPLAIETIQWYADLGLVYGVMPPVERNRVDTVCTTPLDAFTLQRAAMAIGWYSEQGGGLIPWDFSWGAAPLPRDPGGEAVVLAMGYYIGATTAHPQEAWALVRSLAETGGGAIAGYAPASRSAVESEAFRQRVGGDLADTVRLTLEQPAVIGTLDERVFEWMWRFVQEAYLVVHGDATAQEMMDKLAAEFADWSAGEP
jgi:multiple sugar transport system substrate-binding protein